MKKILLLLTFIAAMLTAPAQSIVDNIPIDKFKNHKTSIGWTSEVTEVQYVLNGEFEGPDRLYIDMAYKCRGGVVAKATDMSLEKITVTWHPELYGIHTGVTLIAYASETPYTDPSELYDDATAGTEIGRLVYPDTEIAVSGSHSYVGFRVANCPTDGGNYGAELTAISFSWAGASKEPMEPVTVSNAAGITLADDCKYVVTSPATYLITSDTPDVDFAWSLGNQSGRGTGSVYVTVAAPGVLKVTAEKDGFVSRERSVEFVSGRVIKSVYDAWEAYPMPDAKDQNFGEAFPVEFESTVVYAANLPAAAVVIIYDGTNFSRIYWPGGKVDLAPGDVIGAGWYATFGLNHAWKNFVPVSPLTVVSHDGEIPAPRPVGDEEALQALEPGTPVVVKAVTLPVATSPEAYDGDEAVKQIQTENCGVTLVNAFGLASVDAGKYDVYGVMDFYGYKRSNAPAAGPIDADFSHRRWRVAVTEFEVWRPTSPRPQFALANDSEVDSGEPIVITCQDEAATIMYSMDGENYSEYDAANPPVMPAEDVTVSAYSRQEGYHDSAVRRVSLRYSGKAGIADITLDPAGAAEYYDLTGRRVDSPKAGMYIRVQSGRATKVIL